MDNELIAVAQEFADNFAIFELDNREIAKNLPFESAIDILMSDPENLEGAFTEMRDWIEKHWVPLILEQSLEAQKQAIITAQKW